ncbi:MAG: AFG1 family ATPase [Methylobacteriaceae bacterium]|nr:AFG1 family ATPase [Methylobacteriaceae bacterium]
MDEADRRPDDAGAGHFPTHRLDAHRVDAGAAPVDHAGDDDRHHHSRRRRHRNTAAAGQNEADDRQGADDDDQVEGRNLARQQPVALAQQGARQFGCFGGLRHVRQASEEKAAARIVRPPPLTESFAGPANGGHCGHPARQFGAFRSGAGAISAKVRNAPALAGPAGGQVEPDGQPPDHTLTTLIAIYDRLVASGDIERDAAQVAAIGRLERLRGALVDYRLPRKAGALGWLFAAKRPPPPRGLYIWGSVGRGKTMLMDLFHEAADVERKKRIHFHAFMADAHRRIYEWRRAHKNGEVRGDDPILPTANAIAEEATLLCFDEFAVNDIADAMILGRLFEALWARGVVVAATSNVAPDDLYRDGLNRALFLPFIALLREKMDVVRLDARADFRLEKLAGAPVWHAPADAAARAALDRAFLALTGVAKGERVGLPLLGRELIVPQAARGVARFSFAELCEQPLGPADYLELAIAFHTVICDDIPKMAIDQRNAAKRFITLIDALYDCNARFIASAATGPADLYHADQGREVFEFQRTASRLIEMGSTDYLGRPHGRTAAAGTEGVIET